MYVMYVCMYVAVRGQQRYAVVFLVSGQWTTCSMRSGKCGVGVSGFLRY